MKLAITGALGYSGRYIAQSALQQGHEVLCLTNSISRPNPLQLPIAPLSWQNPTALVESLKTCDVLINTYWVRFDHTHFTHQEAVEHTCILFHAAKTAGLKRIVHVSITKPDETSPLPYFQGKALLEKELEKNELPHSILRPAVLFGETPAESILLNNMDWAMRHFPFVGYFGDGSYCLQPIHVQDFAELALQEAQREDQENVIIQAIGPETYTFKELFTILGKAIGKPRPLISVPKFLGYAVTKCVGLLHHDVMLTKEEIIGLMENRLAVKDASPAGQTKLSTWIQQYAETLGQVYASELSRRDLHS